VRGACKPHTAVVAGSCSAGTLVAPTSDQEVRVQNLLCIPGCAILFVVALGPTSGCYVRASPPPREVYVEPRHEEHEHEHEHEHDEHKEHRDEDRH
jgi:hypothetical protein